MRPADLARVEKGRATRSGLIAAAVQLLEEQGAEATTLQAVAAAAGVTHGAIQRHFGTKSGLLLAVYESLVHEAQGQLAVLATEVASSSNKARTFVRGVYAANTAASSRVPREVEQKAFADPGFAVEVQRVNAAQPSGLPAFAAAFGRTPDRRFRAQLNVVLTSLQGCAHMHPFFSATVIEDVLKELEHLVRTTVMEASA